MADRRDINSSGGERKQRLAAWRKTAAKGRRGERRTNSARNALRRLATRDNSDVPF